jgi:hypothetical protein
MLQVRMRTGDFSQDAPEPSNAHAEAAMNELRNAARETPPPPPPVSLEQLLGHVKCAHEGVDEEPRAA